MADKHATHNVGSKPDWVDTLLASALAAWITVVGTTFALGVMPRFFMSAADILPTMYWFLLVYVFLGFILACVVCAIVGLPALALARLLKLTEWWEAALLGAAAGLLVSLAFPIQLGGAWNEAATMVMFLAAGGFAGIAAWRERRKGRV